MLLACLFLVAGLALLVKGADWLVDGAAALARRLHVSDLAVGLTVVAFGTSTPELFVNLDAAFRNAPDIAIGNILGSNIANILLILGLAAVLVPLSVTRSTTWKEIPFSLLAALILAVLANDRWLDGASANVLSRSEGLVLLAFFVIFLYYTAGMARRPEELPIRHTVRPRRLPVALLLVGAGLLLLILGARWTVNSAVDLATRLGISQAVIALTLVAVGTSLPELATSLVAALRHNPDIAVGNIVGSNIFNIFFILGLTAAVRPLPFPPQRNFDLAVVVLASLLLLLTMFTGKKHRIDRWEGLLFLATYACYIGWLAHTM